MEGMNEKEIITLSASAKYDGNEEKYIEENINIHIKLIKEYPQGFLYQFELLGLENLKADRICMHFFVTEDKIYRLNTLYDYSGEALSSDFIMDNSEIVCQESETDNLKNSSITLNGAQITFSKTETKNNGEVGFYEWFTWEKGKGMVEYGSGYGAERDVLYITQIKK